MTQPHFPGLPSEIKSRILPINDLNMHFLETGDPSQPLVLLLHGFPELAISWRKIMLPIAQLGYHVVAPDQRGYGRTTSRSHSGQPIKFEDDLQSFKLTNPVRDALALTFALGHRTVAAVIGHDFGSGIAAYCALIRPDVFQAVVMMSMPFAGVPSLPFNVDANNSPPPKGSMTASSAAIREGLAALNPPRKYYMAYFAEPHANDDIMYAPQGLHAFLRSYFHMKSADWSGNDPHPLRSATPEELAELPHYYVMPFKSTMPDAVAPYAPSEEEIAHNEWLPDRELAVYAEEYKRTGFQGGLNWYRALQSEQHHQEFVLFAEKQIEVPAMFIGGKKDWGVYQNPGALERMRSTLCQAMSAEDIVLVEGAGHWVQQEQPEEVIKHIKRLLSKHAI